MAEIAIQQLRYNFEVSEWQPIDFCNVQESLQRLKVLTFNVWLADFEKEPRSRALLQELHAHLPDVIFLQEVTVESYDLILADRMIQESFFITELQPGLSSGYGNLTFSRFPLSAATCLNLPGDRKRKAVVTSLSFLQHQVVLVNIHLESKRDAAPARAQQLPLVFEAAENADISVVGGDFNFCSSWEQENQLLDARYIDVWEEVHPDEPGYTEDTARNPMRLDFKNEEKQVRFDRILVRSSSEPIEVASCNLLGTNPITERGSRVYISDHFGVVSEINIGPQ